MIYILHGEETSDSYSRLSQLLKSHETAKKINLTREDTVEDFELHSFSTDLFENARVIVCEDFLKDKKLKNSTVSLLKSLSPDITIVFWEKSQLPVSLINKFARLATIEIFRPKPKIFWFLDSITQNLVSSLKSLANFDSLEPNFLWQLANRVLLLILAKENVDIALVSKFIARPVAPWQWQKIKDQATKFDRKTLIAFFEGLLRADAITKTGKTTLDQKELVPFLFLKYLSV